MQQRIALSQRDIDPETGKFKSREIPDPKNPKQKITVSGEEYAKMLIRAELEKNPDLKVIMIWHESAPGYGIPEELLNMEIPAIAENQKIYGQFITEVERIIHQFPGLKIQIGNSSASIGAVVVPMRAGANPAAYDYVGIETPSQVIPPEKLQECGLQGMQITQDVAEYYAKRNAQRTSTDCASSTVRRFTSTPILRGWNTKSGEREDLTSDEVRLEAFCSQVPTI